MADDSLILRDPSGPDRNFLLEDLVGWVNGVVKVTPRISARKRDSVDGRSDWNVRAPICNRKPLKWSPTDIVKMGGE